MVGFVLAAVGAATVDETEAIPIISISNVAPLVTTRFVVDTRSYFLAMNYAFL
jgi:hypothetical protein